MYGNMFKNVVLFVYLYVYLLQLCLTLCRIFISTKHFLIFFRLTEPVEYLQIYVL